jgi:hypothetical protein
LAIESMNCYEVIPARYARAICDTLLTATDALDIRKACVVTLLHFAKKLDPATYRVVLEALLTAGRGDGDLIIQWMVLEGVGRLGDAGEGVVELLVANLSNRAKSFLWWNSICNAAATSVNCLLEVTATATATGTATGTGTDGGVGVPLVSFPAESLRVIEREREALLNIADKDRSKYTCDVVKAAVGLLRRVDPHILVNFDEEKSSGCMVC